MRPTTNNAEEPEEFPVLANNREPRQFRASVPRRMSRRASINNASTTSLHSVASLSSLASDLKLDDGLVSEEQGGAQQSPPFPPHSHHIQNHLVSQITEWLHNEKLRHAERRGKHKKQSSGGPASSTAVAQERHSTEPDLGAGRRPRSTSETSESSTALEQLEQILESNLAFKSGRRTSNLPERKGSYFGRRPSYLRKPSRKSTVGSSDTEYLDGDKLVPTCEATLDNSKTLGYSGGAAESDGTTGSEKPASKDKEEWVIFKNEIVRLAHTLRLKGWRRVPLDRGCDIDVERLSGALTNAVYVVSPPKDLPVASTARNDSVVSLSSKRSPSKLLLRIYGPQVEHLIDREAELSILRRLARKKIGPRLLGTFTNGRFEEFFNARTLTARDLRIPDTSKQIAKRMRELHDGIDLLEKERDDGPFVWRNWDKWVDRCEQVIMWVDQRILSQSEGSKQSRLCQRGLVCGVEWPMFRRTVERYRAMLDKQYGGPAGVRQQLVFAHNDTQYGNLLRLEPSGESPLLLPANEHKRLVVIDFEYASANLSGLEFANHFTEWCYNYHDPDRPYALNSAAYPTPDEQRRFIRSYVQHRPQFHPSASATPGMTASPGPTSSISAFMLDSRAPPAQIVEDEKRREMETEKEVEKLMHEARLWRVANSAQWVAWGTVQAKVPGMPDGDDSEQKEGKQEESEVDLDKTPSQSPNRGSDPLSKENEGLVQDAHDKRPEEREDDDGDDEFDYLSYAQERAMLFWGDILALGIVKKDELPVEMLQKVKIVNY
ncbi:MAG: hypothetical protein M1812_002047 [Candelaria pacifica]|nr:MAG: hypothetical protein M1812_002047 [Candelaria pacifica]